MGQQPGSNEKVVVRQEFKRSSYDGNAAFKQLVDGI